MVRTASTMLPIGTQAPDFSLLDTDGSTVRLEDFSDAAALLVIFMCNHCPYVKHVAPELKRLSDKYLAKGVAIVAISSNDVTAHPEDSPQRMAEEKRTRGYQFPYLYDETQAVAQTYHAACTPDFFLFDKQRKLAYRGQLDDSRPKAEQPLTGIDLREAIEAVLAGNPISQLQKPSIGCNIKWRPGNEPEYFMKS